MKRTIKNTMACSFAAALIFTTFACGGGGGDDGNGDTGGTSASTSSSGDTSCDGNDCYTTTSAGNYEIAVYEGSESASGAPDFTVISDSIVEVTCGDGVTSDWAGLEVYCTPMDNYIPMVCINGDIQYVDGSDAISLGCGSAMTVSCDDTGFVYVCGDEYYATKDSSRHLSAVAEQVEAVTSNAEDFGAYFTNKSEE